MQTIAIKPLFSNKKTWLYLGFWILVTIIFLWDRKYLIQKAGLSNFFICSVVRIALLILVGWLNIHWLIPKYLAQKKYLAYFPLVLLLILAYLFVQSLYDHYLFGYMIGMPSEVPFSVSLLYNFTHTSLYLVLTVALKFSIDWYEQRKLLQDMRVEKLQAEVNYLRSQVNPHFLFNALNNLYALTIRKSDLAPEVVLKLSEMMEYMLYESDEKLVPLEKEIRYLNNYIELEKLRQGNHADIRFTISGDTDHCSIPPFLLLPLADNAFKHGISQTIQGAYLYIDIKVDRGIEVTVRNNKSGNTQRDSTGGIGLTNLKNRLELLYPGEYDLRIEENSQQYLVALKINRAC